MHRVGSDSALFWAPWKAGVRQPLLIFTPRLALETPKNAYVTQPFRRLPGPREGRGEAATSDFVRVIGVGDP